MIAKISVMNWINSTKFGKAMPMKRPNPPPILLIKVKGSVLGIWVIFSEARSLKEKKESHY